MATLVSSLLTQLRIQIADNPQKFEDRLYTDRQIADFVPTALSDMNRFAITSHAASGVGPINMSLTPTLNEEHQELFVLYLTKTVFQFEADDARRTGFQITNVAGSMDGRGRYTSSREGMRDIISRINKILKRQADRAATSGVRYRSMSRKADPDNTVDTTDLG